MAGFDPTGIIGSVLGFLGGRSNARQAEDSARLQQLTNIQQQKEFAQHGIRWRVEDAKAAGLHPLFALQGGGASFSPNPIVTTEGPDYGALGQNVSRAASAALTSQERDELKQAQIDLAHQQTSESYSREVLNFAQASAVSSKAALDESAQWTEFPGPGPYSHMGQATPRQSENTVVPGQFKGTPHEIVSPDRPGSNRLAGPPEARFKEAQIGEGVSMLLPHQGGQFQEDTSIMDFAPWVAANIRKYGASEFLGRWLAARKGGFLSGVFGFENDAELERAFRNIFRSEIRRR